MKAARDAARLALGEAALFSLNRAAELVPCSDGEARAWLEARGLVRHVNDRPVVRWRDVLDALNEGPAPGASAPSYHPSGSPFWWTDEQ